MIHDRFGKNKSRLDILTGILLAAFSLYVNGFGIHLTIQANIGVAPWDVLNTGLSKSLGILYGDASVAVALLILLIDILMREPIGLAMFIDAVVVGKSVDFFAYLDFVPACDSPLTGIPLMLCGLFIIGYTQYTYMAAALGCGPRDTLLVGLSKRLRRIPIGAVSIGLLSCATLIGWLLGGPVGIGTIISAFCAGPIFQWTLSLVQCDVKRIKHQSLKGTAAVMLGRAAKA